MKKKLLFVIPSLHVGGAEKSLVNLLNEIDFQKYDVDLFLMTKNGAFLDQVPMGVNILEESEAFRNFSIQFHLSLFRFLKNGELKLFWKKILFTISNKISRNAVEGEQKNWQYLKFFFPKFPKKYDVAIGYLEKNANYIVTDKTNADKKIGWIHTDLQQLNLNFDYEKKHFEKLNYIVTVSEGLSNRLKMILPEFAYKIRTVENINSKKIIQKLAKEKTEIDFNSGYSNIIFVGRLEIVKGLDLAVDAIEILLKRNLKVRFYLIGEGSKKEHLNQKVNHLGISESVFFLGMLPNPYPYLKKADIYLLTSIYEGKSISLEEAKILEKAIVITNFSSAEDQIKHSETGLIAEMTAISVAESIEKLIIHNDLKETLKFNLSQMKEDIYGEVKKLYQLIEQ